jgi:hypothetical protein
LDLLLKQSLDLSSSYITFFYWIMWDTFSLV